MTLEFFAFLAAGAGIGGIAIGYFLRWLVTLGKRGSMELEIKKKMLEAEEEAKKIVAKAETKAEQKITEARGEAKEIEEKTKKTEDRLIKKEELLDKRQTDIDKESEDLKQKIEEVKTIKETVEGLKGDRERELQKVAGLSEDEAKKAIMEELEAKYEEDILVRLHKLENVGEEQLERKAQDILAQSIQRMANSVSSDIMSSTVALPSDDVKGKIIGKEGRNIKAFERATGVEVIIDDTPGTIMLSSFDPVRRQVARISLEKLIKDGRIQPARIEEEVEKVRQDVNKIIKEKGEQAAFEVGVINLDPRIISILGRLHFRTSYGQNVLQHSIEMAHIAGVIAEELGANVAIAKAGALLHDIGKAVDHEIQGTHVEIGRRILQKFGADPEIVKAMEAHHEEYPYETIESRIVQTADAISGARPGARRDTVENYLKRLADLEATANSFPGVDKSYALQAGREVRIFVQPDEVSDLEAKKLARDIAIKIEQELKYPGEIKVNVIRENRIIEYAR
jgi:ribonuclease Y